MSREITSDMLDGCQAKLTQIKADAKQRQAQAKGKARGEKQASVPQLFGEQIDSHDRETDAVRAKAAGTNRQYIAAAVFSDGVYTLEARCQRANSLPDDPAAVNSPNDAGLIEQPGQRILDDEHLPAGEGRLGVVVSPLLPSLGGLVGRLGNQVDGHEGVGDDLILAQCGTPEACLCGCRANRRSAGRRLTSRSAAYRQT
ncbi:MAG: hypothetical protein GXY83_00465 [Rhodopirellula sp.]|nr:hypothetical protein [Rhodopirellula sp.]